MKKSTLTKKILCSVLAASAFGFYYADNAFAATVNNDKHLITNENLDAEVGSCKLIVGQGKLDIQTNGSVGTVLANFAQGKDLLSALAPTKKPDGTIVYAPLVGVVGGEGKMDKNTLDNLVFAKTMLPLVDKNLANKLTPIIDKVANINTLDKKVDNNVIGSADKKADINVNIGGENSEPVVMGAVGGDFSFNANLATKDTTGATDPNSIERFGDVNMNINSGNVLGGVGGSAAVSVGNVKIDTKVVFPLHFLTNGNTKTTINGDVNTNVKDAANLAAWMNGGAAVAIGGKAESVVNGSTNVNIDSAVNGAQLEGLTAGVAGGGLAVSTLGSTATSTVNGDTNIGVNNGLAVGLVGGGMAGSVDATWVGQKLTGHEIGNNGNFTDITDEQLEALLGKDSGIPDSTIVLNGVYDGGTATATTKDTHINLTGTTTAAGVIGGGVAGALHDFVARGDEHGTRPEGVQQGEVLGSSEAVANTGKTYINVNVTNKNGKPLTSEEKGELIQGLKDIKAAAKELANKNSDAVIGKLESAATNLADKGAVMGVAGGGVAIGYSGNNASLAKDSKGAVATATNAGAEINLNSGYVVGALGGGMALSNRNAHAEAVTTDDINVNLNGAEVIGVFGNGFAGAKDGIHNSQQKDSGYAKTTATNTNININAGSADGVFGGGLAVTTGKNHTETSKVDTTGTSTINVAAKVDTLKYENLNSVFDDGMMHDMFGAQFDAVKKEAKDVAIFGGGVAAGQGAVSHVKDSVININSGAEITGDVVAGGLAVVDGKSTVDNSVINWNGGSISGVLNGSGIGSAEAGVKNDSVLNVNGNVELSAVQKDGQDVSKITQFDKVNFKAGTETTVSGLTAGNTTALIDGNNCTITVEDGARLNITKLDKADDAYLIASGYNDKSTLWENKDLAYDRTESYASATNKEGKYTVTYKDLSNLTDAESEQAIHDFVGSLGEHGGALEGIVEGIVNNGDKTNAGAKDFFGDITSSDKLNETALAAGTLFGEAAGVTSTTAAVAKDMAENAALRLSFTQDTVNADPIDENGAVWAKYLHNKHKVDGMDSSVGALNSESSYDGVTVGYDLAKHGNMQTGIAFSYVDGDGNGLGVDNDFDMWGLNIYGNIKQDDVNFIADLGYSKGSHDLSGTINGKAMTADRDLSVLSAGIRAEKLYINGNTQIVPYAGLRYMSIDSDDYTTYYGGKAAFENSADTQNVWTMPIGVSLRNETATASGWRITPQVDLAYVWAFGDTDNDVTVNAGSGASVLNYDVMDSGSWVGSLAVEAAKDDWSFGVGYSYQKGSDAQDNKWFANVNYSF